MSEGEANIQERLTRSISAYHETTLLYAAVKLGLAGKMGAASWYPEALAAALGLSAPHLARFLRGLCIIGLCEERPAGVFTLTPLGQSLGPGSHLGTKVQIVVEQYWQPWTNLVVTLRDGMPAFQQVFGSDVFAWRRAHAEQGALFASFLAKQNAAEINAIVDAIDISDGATVAVLQVQPQYGEGSFDGERRSEISQPFLRLLDVAARVEFVPGNLLEEIPVEADLLLLIGILQQYPDQDAVTILKNCRAAMRKGVRLLIVERLLPARPTDDPDAVMLDLHMMIITGGRARTLADFEALLLDAGLTVSNATATRAGPTIIEAS